MPQDNQTLASDPSQYNCGPLTPQPGDDPIDHGASPQSILAKVMLMCDDDTGVFFYRYNQNLYMRVIKIPS